MNHTFFSDPRGFFLTTYNGPVSLNENRFIVEKMIEMVNSRVDRGEKAYILTDLTNLTSVDPGSLTFNAKALNATPVEYIAAAVPNAITRTVVQSIVTLAGDSKKIHMFESREEAERWLLEQINA